MELKVPRFITLRLEEFGKKSRTLKLSAEGLIFEYKKGVLKDKIVIDHPSFERALVLNYSIGTRKYAKRAYKSFQNQTKMVGADVTC